MTICSLFFRKKLYHLIVYLLIHHGLQLSCFPLPLPHKFMTRVGQAGYSDPAAFIVAGFLTCPPQDIFACLVQE